MKIYINVECVHDCVFEHVPHPAIRHKGILFLTAMFFPSSTQADGLLGGTGRGDLIEQFMTIKHETQAPLSQKRPVCISSPLGRALHLKPKQNRFVPVLLVKLKLFSANLKQN